MNGKVYKTNTNQSAGMRSVRHHISVTYYCSIEKAKLLVNHLQSIHEPTSDMDSGDVSFDEV